MFISANERFDRGWKLKAVVVGYNFVAGCSVFRSEMHVNWNTELF
jgi:hypothetical protein